jgi:hypothetical protein
VENNKPLFTTEDIEAVNQMSKEEADEFIKSKAMELESKCDKLKEDLYELTDYNYVTDQTIIRAIESTAFNSTLYALAYYFIPILAIILCSRYRELSKFESAFILASSFALVFIVSAVVEQIRRPKYHSFALKHYHESTIFTSQFIKIKVRYGKRRSYYIYFNDEFGHIRKCQIPTEEYKRIKSLCTSPTHLCVLKYPKHRGGWAYMAFDASAFQNHSKVR